MKSPERTSSSPTPRVAIIGSGFGGLCMAIQLRKAGIESFTVFEREQTLGGTWRDNHYPGSGCDVPSHLYSYSFFPNPDFTRKYSGQAEIEAYLDRAADEYDVRRHIRFGTAIASARFDDATCEWELRTGDGEVLRFDVVVSATGQLNRPFVPDFPGLADFTGEKFHSARFPKDYDATGRRVIVLGSGATAIQIVPELARSASELAVFQRTPSYVVPRDDHTYSERARDWFRRFPLLLLLVRFWIYWLHEVRIFALQKDNPARSILTTMAARHLETQVADPGLRAALTPTYEIGCKRVLISDDFYPALAKDNVRLVTENIDRFVPEGIVTKDGAVHRADDVVFATGFDSMAFLAPMEIRGRKDRALSEAWRDGAEAYLGIAVSGFPNLFLLYGPNTNLGHNSIIFMLECQVRYVLQCLGRIGERGGALDVRADEMARYNRQLQEALEQTAWSAGCTSWYKNASGKITNNWPSSTVEYWWRTREPEFHVYEVLTSRRA